MKPHLYTLAFLLAALIPASLLAQETTKAVTSSISNLTMPTPNLNMGTKRALNQFKPNFPNFLSTRAINKTIDSVMDNPDSSPKYRYNMPIVKPGKTSKIIVAKLDKDFPYQYNMPVVSDGGVK